MTQNTAVAIGNFDGVHRGHLKVIDRLKSEARRIGGQSVVLTFLPHPQLILRPERSLFLLSTYDERRELLQRAGVSRVVEEPFSRDFSNLSARDFFDSILLKKLRAKALVVGYDFAFGKNREGDLTLLKAFAKDAHVEVVVEDAFSDKDEVISSSVIRRLISSADVETAAQKLGYDFFYQGIVEHGLKQGRKMGFPTLNLSLTDPMESSGRKIVPPYGVYVTEMTMEGGAEIFRSVSNIGVRPTMIHGVTAPTLETHLLKIPSGREDFYGKMIKVSLKKFIRPEKKFSSVDELKKQIATDVQTAREFFDGRSLNEFDSKRLS